jgi:hypothetical protein
VGLGFEGFRSVRVFLRFSFCGLVWLFLCILPVYLGASYAFFNKTFITYQKKFVYRE